MKNNHRGGRLKRESAPRFWSIPRKKLSFVVTPKPGPYRIEECLPLALVVYEVLGLVKTRREGKKLLSQGKVIVDGRIRRSSFFPVGLMSVISIPKINKNYRVLPTKKGLSLNSINAEEASFKLNRIENKRVVKSNSLQLNLHDGRNIVIKVDDPQYAVASNYSTLSTLKVNLKDQAILEYLEFADDMFVLVTGGKNMGKSGQIRSIEMKSGRTRRKSLVTIGSKEGKEFQTICDYIFVIGDENPFISLNGLEAS